MNQYRFIARSDSLSTALALHDLLGLYSITRIEGPEEAPPLDGYANGYSLSSMLTIVNEVMSECTDALEHFYAEHGDTLSITLTSDQGEAGDILALPF